MFEPTFDSLGKYECPEWFRDAKFGIWSHWGPQSVPMCGDWYARHMYIQDHPQYLYHLRHYGHPSEFGYKDICNLWKAEKFDPEGLMDKFYKAGARYFVGQAMHHDHFFNYQSKLNRFNSTQIGPMKDICRLWQNAANKYGLPFGLTEHLGASFSWWKTNKWSDAYGPYAGIPYDGNDEEYRDFYFNNYEHFDRDHAASKWYTDNKEFRNYWLNVIKEVIDLFKPDLLYTDGSLPFGSAWHDQGDKTFAGDPAYELGLQAVAHLYNVSIEKNGYNKAVYVQKDRRREIYRVGLLDIEKSQLPGISEEPWQTDTCIGNWFYDAKMPFKKPGHIIEMLVDIVSKNGTMLLNILQRPDGSIDNETEFILNELARWYAICGEGIYGTRPYDVYGEGSSKVLIEGFKEDKTEWSDIDFRYTRKGTNVYAFTMKPSAGGVLVMRSFMDKKVRSVKLLGGDALQFAQNFNVLSVKLPEVLPTSYVNCLRIEL